MVDLASERFNAQLPGLLAELERRAQALFGLTLTPTADSLPSLEQIASFLHQARASFDEQDQRINILLLGAYLGEIVRRERGGVWRVDAALGLPLVDLPGGEVWSPMDAAQSRLAGSAGAFHLPNRVGANGSGAANGSP